ETGGAGNRRRRARQGASSAAAGICGSRDGKGRAALRAPVLLGGVRPRRRQGLNWCAGNGTARGFKRWGFPRRGVYLWPRLGEWLRQQTDSEAVSAVAFTVRPR